MTKGKEVLRKFGGWIYKRINGPVGFFIAGFIASMFFFSFCIFVFNFFDDFIKDDAGKVADIVYYGLIVALTALIAYIAYSKIKNINDAMRTEYLLRIDRRWCSKEMIDARIAIHKIYVKLTDGKWGHDTVLSMLSDKLVRELAGSKKREDISDYIHILNLLDFLETIGYLHAQGKLKTDEITELCGNSILYYSHIFKGIIERRQKRDPGFYEYFTKLAKEIEIDTLKPDIK